MNNDCVLWSIWYPHARIATNLVAKTSGRATGFSNTDFQGDFCYKDRSHEGNENDDLSGLNWSVYLEMNNDCVSWSIWYPHARIESKLTGKLSGRTTGLIFNVISATKNENDVLSGLNWSVCLEMNNDYVSWSIWDPHARIESKLTGKLSGTTTGLVFKVISATKTVVMKAMKPMFWAD